MTTLRLQRFRFAPVLGAASLLLCAATAPAPAGAPGSDPDKLVILFPEGSASLGARADATLDQASHLYRAGNPIVMVVTGSADTSGDPAQNLTLSERRARVVLNGLVSRGIPVAKLQLLAAGATEPSGDGGPADPDNRRAVITWR